MPPLTTIELVYGVPTVPEGSDVVLMLSVPPVDPFTEMLSAAVWICCGVPVSATFTVKYEVPVAVGVPEMPPVLVRVKPEGNDPVSRLQVRVPVPPVAASA